MLFMLFILKTEELLLADRTVKRNYDERHKFKNQKNKIKRNWTPKHENHSVITLTSRTKTKYDNYFKLSFTQLF